MGNLLASNFPNMTSRQAVLGAYSSDAAGASGSSLWPLGPAFWRRVGAFPWAFTNSSVVCSGAALGRLLLALTSAAAASPCGGVAQSYRGVVAFDLAPAAAEEAEEEERAGSGLPEVAPFAAGGEGGDALCVAFKAATDMDRLLVLFPGGSMVLREDAGAGGKAPAQLPTLLLPPLRGLESGGGGGGRSSASDAAAVGDDDDNLRAHLPILLAAWAVGVRHYARSRGERPAAAPAADLAAAQASHSAAAAPGSAVASLALAPVEGALRRISGGEAILGALPASVARFSRWARSVRVASSGSGGGAAAATAAARVGGGACTMLRFRISTSPPAGAAAAASASISASATPSSDASFSFSRISGGGSAPAAEAAAVLPPPSLQPFIPTATVDAMWADVAAQGAAPAASAAAGAGSGDARKGGTGAAPPSAHFPSSAAAPAASASASSSSAASSSAMGGAGSGPSAASAASSGSASGQKRPREGERGSEKGGLAPPPAPAHRMPQPSLPSVTDKRSLRRVERPPASVHAASSSPPPPLPLVSLAIIVPYRSQAQQNRAEQLASFAEFMPRFLLPLVVRAQAPAAAGGGGGGASSAPAPALARFHVFVVEQSDDGFKFNRGKLLNAGFAMAAQADFLDAALLAAGSPPAASSSAAAPLPPFNAFCFHDVDLLPAPAVAPSYARFPRVPQHIGAVWPRYVKPGYAYVGGILTLSRETMVDCNGFPNNFWGWGGEDDVLSDRLAALRVAVEKPAAALSGSIVDLEEEFIKSKGGIRASTKLKEGGQLAFKCMWKTELRAFHNTTGHVEGLRTLDFALLSARALSPHVTVLRVDLKGGDDVAAERLEDGGENIGLEVSAATTRGLFERLYSAYGQMPPKA